MQVTASGNPRAVRFASMGGVRTLLLSFLLLMLAGCSTNRTIPPVRPPRVSLSAVTTRPVPVTLTGSTAYDRSAVSSLDFLNGQLGWAVHRAFCNTGTCPQSILSTSDGGRRWIPVFSTDAYQIQAIRFATAQVGYAIGQRGACDGPGVVCDALVLRSGDGGRTWTVIHQVPNHTWLALAVQGTGSVWVAGQTDPTWDCVGNGPCQGRILYSGDGGRSWTTQYRGAFPVTGMAFSGPDTGWAITYRSRLLYTVNGGASWIPGVILRNGQGNSFEPGSVQFRFAGPRQAWVGFCDTGTVDNGGCQNYLFHTTDGGSTWTEVWGAGCIDSSYARMNGQGSGLLVTMGSTLCQSGPPSNRLLTTRSGGTSWQPVHHFPFNLQDAGFVNSHQGWVAGGSETCIAATGPQYSPCGGVIQATTDGGQTWSQQFPAPSPTLAVDMLGKEEGYGIGTQSDPSAVLRTGNGGRTWAVVGKAPFTGNLFPGSPLQLDFVHTRTGYLAFQNSLWRTQTGGRSWSRVKAGGYVAALSFSTARKGWVAVENLACIAFSQGRCLTRILQTTDGGRHWTTVGRFPSGIRVQGMGFATATRGWAIGWEKGCSASAKGCRARLYRSVDGGRTWNRVPAPAVSEPFAGLDVVNSRQIALLGPGNLYSPTNLWVTRDGGSHWETLVFSGPTPAEVDFTGPRTGWVLLSDGRLAQTRDGGRKWSLQ